MSNEISMSDYLAQMYQPQTPPSNDPSPELATDKNKQDLFDAVMWLADDASTSEKKRVKLFELAAKLLGK